jgi:hypothetical protein
MTKEQAETTSGIKEPKETADLSTTLRSGRDDNFVWQLGLAVQRRLVISTGAKRSGEICGFFWLAPRQTLKLGAEDVLAG